VKPKYLSCLLLTLLFFAACQNCPVSGKANTKYLYKYTTDTGETYTGTVTTDDQGKAEVPDVPEDFDCSEVEFMEDSSFSMDNGSMN
jgi:hypothetical protein